MARPRWSDEIAVHRVDHAPDLIAELVDVGASGEVVAGGKLRPDTLDQPELARARDGVAPPRCLTAALQEQIRSWLLLIGDKRLAAKFNLELRAELLQLFDRLAIDVRRELQ